MGRRGNYGFEKRQKEIGRQKKRAEKAEKRKLKKEGAKAADGTAGSAGAEGEAPQTGNPDAEREATVPDDHD